MSEPRITTKIRIPESLHSRLKTEAGQRDLSVNWMMNKAIETFLDNLIPVDEIQWVREK